jgi:hypothetical protein
MPAAKVNIFSPSKKSCSTCRFTGCSFDVSVKGKVGSAAQPAPWLQIEVKRRITMRVMVFVKASKDSEAGVLPSAGLLTAMGKFNEELVKSGVLLDANGLHASSKGKRVKFSGQQRTVIDGPFAETKELIAGYWLWQVKSIEEAVEWLKRAPFDGGTEVEIRPVFEAADFGAQLSPELKAQEERLRAASAKIQR